MSANWCRVHLKNNGVCTRVCVVRVCVFRPFAVEQDEVRGYMLPVFGSQQFMVQMNMNMHMAHWCLLGRFENLFFYNCGQSKRQAEHCKSLCSLAGYAFFFKVSL